MTQSEILKLESSPGVPHLNFSESRISSLFQQLLTILAQYTIWPKMPVKGLPRDSKLLA